jgi:hypothetical protein
MLSKTPSVLAIVYAIIPLSGLWISGCSGPEPLRFDVKPGNISIKPRESVTVEAVPTNVGDLSELAIKYRAAGSTAWDSSEMDLSASETETTFAHTFLDIRQDLEYVLDVHDPNEGIGPYRITVIPYSQAHNLGFGLAVSYQTGEIKDYVLVIELNSLSGSEREEFLQGFERAYEESGEPEKGNEFVKILKESVSSDTYPRGHEQGQKHVDGQVTDAKVQNLIRRSIGISKAVALGWKAGYINGYSKIGSDEAAPADERDAAYQEAQAMYSALRAITGL